MAKSRAEVLKAQRIVIFFGLFFYFCRLGLSRRGLSPSSSHTTVRTDRYTAVRVNRLSPSEGLDALG